MSGPAGHARRAGLGAVGLLAAIMAPAAAETMVGRPLLVSCDATACIWQLIDQRQVVVRVADGTLYRIALRTATTTNTTPSEMRHIEGPVEHQVFCSRARPTILTPDGDGWIAQGLSPGRLSTDVLMGRKLGGPSAGPAPELAQQVVYFATCHDREMPRDQESRRIIAWDLRYDAYGGSHRQRVSDPLAFVNGR